MLSYTQKTTTISNVAHKYFKEESLMALCSSRIRKGWMAPLYSLDDF